jgi:hypothetical protein
MYASQQTIMSPIKNKKQSGKSLDLKLYRDDYEEFYLLGYNTVQTSEGQLIFWKNILSPSSGLNSKTNNTPP